MLGRAVVALSLLAVALLVLAALGLLPAREPGPIRTEELDVKKAVGAREGSAPKSATRETPAPELRLASTALCKAPERGARGYRLVLGPERDGVLVWCDGGYELFGLSLAAGYPVLERLARFGSERELPGGATAADFDGDGAIDLMLGVAPEERVLHHAGAGVYFLRGRVQGGYEPARPVIETPTVALAAAELNGQAPGELIALTRGDLAAQRDGELWLFAGGSALTRVAAVPVGLDPRDLVLATSKDAIDHELRALVIAGRPGSLSAAKVRAAEPGAEFRSAVLVEVSLTKELLSGARAAPRMVSARGAQAFVTALGGDAAFVRDPSDLSRVRVAPELGLEPWAKDANVGPGVVLDIEGDGVPEVLAATKQGVALIREAGKGAPSELALGEGRQVRDVLALRDLSGRERVLLLVEDTATRELAFVTVPLSPWREDVKVVIERAAVRDAPGLAVVPLES